MKRRSDRVFEVCCGLVGVLFAAMATGLAAGASGKSEGVPSRSQPATLIMPSTGPADLAAPAATGRLPPAAPGAARSVVERIPGPGDTTPAYAQDDHWLDPGGQTWTMREQGHGQAIWLHQETSAPPIDEIGGRHPVAAYGTRRLTAGYAGPALNLVRNTDGAMLDIGFLASGGLDETLLAAFCARTECRVDRWYDQGGKGNDATQDIALARPVIRLSHRVGNAVSVVWDFETTSGAPPRFLVLPDGVSLNSASMSILWTGRFHNASMISPLIELGTRDEPFGFGFWDAHGDFYIGNAKHLGELPGHASSTPAVGLISASPDSTVTIYRNHLLEIPKMAAAPHSGGFIGRSKAFEQFGMMELGSLVLYDRPFSPGERFYGMQALGETFAIAQQQQDTYVVDGDSITQGIASLYLQSYQRDMERLLPTGFVFYNAAWAGKTLDGPGGLLDRFGPFTSRLYNPNARNNILSVLAGTNDLQNGETGAHIFDLLGRYAASARKAGFRVVVCTVLPRRSFTPAIEAERRSLNALVAGGWRGMADGFVDLAADPVLGPEDALKDPNVYILDGIHLTDYGYQTLASDMAEVVNRLVR